MSRENLIRMARRDGLMPIDPFPIPPTLDRRVPRGRPAGTAEERRLHREQVIERRAADMRSRNAAISKAVLPRRKPLTSAGSGIRKPIQREQYADRDVNVNDEQHAAQHTAQLSAHLL